MGVIGWPTLDRIRPRSPQSNGAMPFALPQGSTPPDVTAGQYWLPAQGPRRACVIGAARPLASEDRQIWKLVGGVRWVRTEIRRLTAIRRDPITQISVAVISPAADPIPLEDGASLFPAQSQVE